MKKIPEIPVNWKKISTLDMHTGGEPLRIVTSGIPDLQGSTLLEKRQYFRLYHDDIRIGLMHEPRGHDDMYGALLLQPTHPEADVGVVFMHNEGYSTMCGHGIIALTKMVIETGMIERSVNEPVTFETPAGLVEAKAVMESGRVVRSSFKNVPSFIYKKDMALNILGIGEISLDIAFGGAFYVFVDAGFKGIDLVPENHNSLKELGRLITRSVSERVKIVHPFIQDLGFLYGTIFTGPPMKQGNHSRHACIFGDGQLDRSATGTGVSARAALLHDKAGLSMGVPVSIESVIGTTMDVEIIEETVFGQYKAIIPQVSGQSFYTGRSEFWFDPDDHVQNGFLIN